MFEKITLDVEWRIVKMESESDKEYPSRASQLSFGDTLNWKQTLKWELVYRWCVGEEFQRE